MNVEQLYLSNYTCPFAAKVRYGRPQAVAGADGGAGGRACERLVSRALGISPESWQQLSALSAVASAGREGGREADF